MSVPTVRVVAANYVCRLFQDRRDAINECNARTKIEDQQHQEVRVLLGYIVQNVVTKQYYDGSGRMPDVAAEALVREKETSK